MPEVSRFFGVVVRMFHNEHNPPHFHCYYSGEVALIEIRTLSVFSGHLPPRALGLAIERATLHQDELLENWNRARKREPPLRIEPLR
jgi:hypothetical protein